MLYSIQYIYYTYILLNLILIQVFKAKFDKNTLYNMHMTCMYLGYINSNEINIPAENVLRPLLTTILLIHLLLVTLGPINVFDLEFQ